MSNDEVSARLITFIRETFLADGDPKNELTETTPLLEWGILTSMNTVTLLSFMQAEFGAAIPATEINARNFQNVRNISAMIHDLALRVDITVPAQAGKDPDPNEDRL